MPDVNILLYQTSRGWVSFLWLRYKWQVAALQTLGLKFNHLEKNLKNKRNIGKLKSRICLLKDVIDWYYHTRIFCNERAIRRETCTKKNDVDCRFPEMFTVYTRFSSQKQSETTFLKTYPSNVDCQFLL